MLKAYHKNIEYNVVLDEGIEEDLVDNELLHDQVVEMIQDNIDYIVNNAESCYFVVWGDGYTVLGHISEKSIYAEHLLNHKYIFHEA